MQPRLCLIRRRASLIVVGIFIVFAAGCSAWAQAQQALLYETIWESAEHGAIGDIDIHLRAGVALNATRGGTMPTPLMVAAAAGQAEMVDYLIEKGANVRLTGEGGWTALHCAAEGGYPDVVKRLIDAGADVNARAHEGRTPAWQAMVSWDMNGEANFVEVMRHLLDNGADPNYTPHTNDDGTPNDACRPLMVAIGRPGILPNIEMVRLLLSRGADTSFLADDRRLIDIAGECHEQEILDALFDALARHDPRFPARGAEVTKTVRCRENLRELALAMFMYAVDHDNILPDASDWQRAIQPYVADVAVLSCPCGHRYIMNRRLSRAIFGSPSVLLFEADAEGRPLKQTHLQGAVYAFGNGGAQWLPADRAPER